MNRGLRPGPYATLRGGAKGSAVKQNPARVILLCVLFFIFLVYAVLQYTIIKYMFLSFRFPTVNNTQWLLLYIGVALLLPLIMLWPLIVTIKKKRNGWTVFSAVSILLCMFMGYLYGNMALASPPLESRCAVIERYLLLDDAARDSLAKERALFPQAVPEDAQDAQYSYVYAYVFNPYYHIDMSASWRLPKAAYDAEKARALALMEPGTTETKDESGMTRVTLLTDEDVSALAMDKSAPPVITPAHKTLSFAYDDASLTVAYAFEVNMEDAAMEALGTTQEGT